MARRPSNSAPTSRVALLSAAIALLGGGVTHAEVGGVHAEPPINDAGTGTSMPEGWDMPPPAPVFTYNLTAASNYIFRGVSQTEDAAAVFGGAKVSYDHFYLAAGGENVDFHNGIKAEYDLSGGWTPTIDKFNFDLGAIRYGYIDEPTGVSIDTIELRGAVTRQFGALKLGGAVNHALDYFGTKRPATYFEANAGYKLTSRLTASGTVGRQEIDAGHSFTTWNVGGAYALTKHVALGLRYADTNSHDYGKLYHSHLVASLKVGF